MTTFHFFPTSKNFKPGMRSLLLEVAIKAARDYIDLKRLGVIVGTLPRPRINIKKRELRDYLSKHDVKMLIDYINNSMERDLKIACLLDVDGELDSKVSMERILDRLDRKEEYA